MVEKTNNFIEQYEKCSEKYIKFQTEFYSKRSDYSRKILYSYVSKISFKNKKILDMGCGSGKDLVYFKNKGADVYGIDASKKMIELAQKNNPTLTNLSVQQFTKTNFKNDFFDIIISRYALHYAISPEKVFREIYRILEPQGYAVILVAHPLLTFMANKKREYHKKTIVKIPLYGNKIVIKEPTHTFADYLNDFVLKRFNILAFYESHGLENQPKEVTVEEIVPDFLLLKLRKR